MKIKITLIAFLASAMMFTSCMKNESSPGIEKVREAYASLLLAKASAELIIANADATFTNALAAVEIANAAIAQAEADGLVADAERLRALLAHEILMWEQALRMEQHRIDSTLAAYQTALAAANNQLALDYYTEYKDALALLRGVQNDIFIKNAAILVIIRDIANGTTVQQDALDAELAAAQAQLANLQAELVTVEGLLSNKDAMMARLAELVNDSTTYSSLKLDLMAQKAECNASLPAAPGVPDPTAYNDAAAAAIDTVQAKLDFFVAYVAPTFWTDAQGDIDTANDSLITLRTDSANAYGLWETQSDIIDNQYDDLEEDKQDAQDLIDGYNDDIDAYGLDTLNTLGAWDLAVGQWTQDTSDNAQRQRDLDILTDSLTAQRIRYIATPTAGLLATITVNAGDSTQFEIDIAFHDTNTIPDAVQDTVDAHGLWVTADNTYDTEVNTPVTGLLALIDDEQAIIDNIDNVLWGQRTNLIANAEATIDDLWSDYLYAVTWIDEQVEVLARAIAAKDALQVQYEQYMDEFFWDTWMAGLEQDASDAWDAYKLLKDAYDEALEAYNLLNAPCLDLQDDIDAAEAQLQFIDDVTLAYRNAINYNTDAMDAVQDLIDAKLLEISKDTAPLGLEQQIAALALEMEDEAINLEERNLELASLTAQLTTLQAQVDYWKALLDAIVNGL